MVPALFGNLLRGAACRPVSMAVRPSEPPASLSPPAGSSAARGRHRPRARQPRPAGRTTRADRGWSACGSRPRPSRWTAGPSMTASVTSSPREAGRQCMNLASGAAMSMSSACDLVRRIEDGHALVLRQLLVVQAVPHVGVHEVGVACMASSRLSVTVTLPPDTSQFLRPMASRSSRIWCPSGPYCTKSMPIFEADEHLGHAHLRGVAHEHHLAVLDALALGQVLDHGEEVAHLLRGVVVVGHAVDHGHRARTSPALRCPRDGRRVP